MARNRRLWFGDLLCGCGWRGKGHGRAPYRYEIGAEG